MDTTKRILEYVSRKYHNYTVIIGGGFNINFVVSDGSKTKRLLDFSKRSNLEKTGYSPTRVKA